MKKAWIENDIVRDYTEFDPNEVFTAEVAVFYNTDIDDSVIRGATLIDGIWVNPEVAPEVEPIAQTPTTPIFSKVSPIEFKLLFTSSERIAIKAARATDEVIDDFFTIIDDPRLTYVDLGLASTNSALDYLVSSNLITIERKQQILNATLV